MSTTEARPVSTAPRFISLRWRLFLPTFAIVLMLAMVSAYAIARSLPSSAEMSRVNVLLNNGRLISDRAAAIFDRQQSEAERLAPMPEVQTALRDRRSDDLQALLENFARRGDLDSRAGHRCCGRGRLRHHARRAGQRSYMQTTLAAGIDSGDLLGCAGGRSIARDALRRHVASRAGWTAVRGSAAAEVALYQGAPAADDQPRTPAALPATLPAEYLAARRRAASDEPFQALDLDGRRTSARIPAERRHASSRFTCRITRRSPPKPGSS